MSTHPNAMLVLVLTPDNLARKTFRAIVEEAGSTEEDATVKIGGLTYSCFVMEDTYNESWQISAPEGSIVLHDYLTYGYGERMKWYEVLERVNRLEEWAREASKRHVCAYEISIGANYW